VKKRISTKTQVIPSLMATECLTAIKLMDNEKHKVALSLMLFTGLRYSEVLQHIISDTKHDGKMSTVQTPKGIKYNKFI